MHIMEGFLPPQWCLLWYAFALPFVALGAWRIKRSVESGEASKWMVATAAAFIFVLSALKMPSVTGSCSHPTGTGVAVVLYGPSVTAFLSVIVLLFQALLLAHGGITTLGANTASMGIIGPFAGFVVFKALRKFGVGFAASTFATACVADWVTYVVTSFQLALAFPAGAGGFAGVLHSAALFLGIFAVTQVPLAIAEGILAAALLKYLLKLGVEDVRRIAEKEVVAA
ncbi:MAG: energy-coupling factor ABC transporter permease [Methanophagales archaeon]|nr:energy-coupling factor ABC transporter permease [Methanophagales archaeon]